MPQEAHKLYVLGYALILKHLAVQVVDHVARHDEGEGEDGQHDRAEEEHLHGREIQRMKFWHYMMIK